MGKYAFFSLLGLARLSHILRLFNVQLACPGGAVIFVGCPSNPVPLDTGHMQIRELRTEAIFRYAHVYPKAIALLESGSINLKPIITNHYQCVWKREKEDERKDKCTRNLDTRDNGFLLFVWIFVS